MDRARGSAGSTDLAGPRAGDGGRPASAAGPTLVRGLGTWDVSLITFGSIVGSAIFIAASIVPRAVPHPTLIVLLWVLGGVLSMAGVVTYAELGTMFPEAGGPYHVLKEAYGSLWGFLFGWTSFLVIQSGGIAYLSMAAFDSLSPFWPAVGPERVLAAIPVAGGTWRIHGDQVAAAALIALLTAVNYLGLRAGAGLQNAISVVKVLSMAAFVVFGLTVRPAVVTAWSQPLRDERLWAGTGVAMIGVLWCYDAWYQATFCAGEVRDPGHSLPRGMIVGTLLCGVLYTLVTIVYLRALPPHDLGAAAGIGQAAALSLFGAAAARAMALAIVLSIVGCLAAAILTAPRIYLAMAQDGLFFRALARIHPVYRTPGPCLLAQAIWSALLACTGTYEQLGTYVIFAVFLFHTAIGAALFVLRRRRPRADRPYRAWGFPWTPVVFILTALAFVISTLVEKPVESLWGLVVVALGLPAYAWWKGPGARVVSPRTAVG